MVEAFRGDSMGWMQRVAIAVSISTGTVLAASGLALAGTPRALRHQISKEVARILELPDIRERLHGVGFQIAPTTPEEHERNLRSDIAIFTKIVRDAGLRPR